MPPEPYVPSAARASGDGATSSLTTSQFLMWVGQSMYPDVPLYNMVHTFEIEGALQKECFEAAFQALLDRSDALRTVIERKGGGPVQRVRPPYAFELECVDLTSEPSPDAALRDWTDARRSRPLDQSQTLFDMALLKMADERSVWYLNQHHVITDIWSVSLICRHMADFYVRARDGRLDDAPPLPSFADYVAHEHAFRTSDEFESAADHWAATRDVLPESPRLYGQQPERETTRTERVRRVLSASQSERLQALTQRDGIRALTSDLTRYSIFAAMLIAFLRRVSGQRELAIGTPSHNRATGAFKKTIGLFIEVFPLQAEVNDDDTLIDLVQKVQREAMQHLRYAQPGTSTAGANRSYNALLNYIPVSLPSTFDGHPMTSEWIHSGHGDTRHHLRLQVHDLNETGTPHLLFDFNADLFDAAQREAAADQFLRLLDAFLDDPTQLIVAPGLLGETEQRHLLTAGESDRAQPSTCPSSVVAMIEAQVAQTPAAPAVVQGDTVLTYRMLDAQSDRLALKLHERGVGPETRVGLYLDRSADAVVAIVAVLKAGGTYVPLVPSHPDRLLVSILSDAQVDVTVTRSTLPPALAAEAACVLDLEAAGVPSPSDPSVAPLDEPFETKRPAADQAAYVLYTSGSTGTPKGVVVEHGALAQYLDWARQYYLDGQPGDFSLFTSLAVDLTVTSLFTPLITGGRVVVHPDAPDPASLLHQVVQGEPVDVIKMTPSHFALIEHLDLSDRPIHTVILGGEDLKTTRAQKVVQSFGDGTAVYNEYGPTEATVGCVVHPFDAEQDTGDSVPIGQPAAQARVYVLDEAHNLVPPGVVGELYVAGPGLARGYLNRPDETAERFLDDPFRPGERMYRTGDRVRWQPRGVLEYVGRTDDQVQVRGARVELGQIEAALHEHPAIQRAVVTADAFERRDDANMYCARCGLPSNYPGATFDDDGVCHLCRAFDRYKDRVEQYFRGMDDLRSIFDSARTARNASNGSAGSGAMPEYDCLMLLSGGKDSTYALARLVDMGLRVLTFTLANGYISDEAKENIRRVTDELGVDHIFGETPAMKAIFADSLERFSNVCNGCFKTIYTLALQEAQDRNIPFIVTGLSRGQFFETRLTEDLFLTDEIDPDRIDQVVLEARKAYHRVDDAVARLLDVDALQDGAVFDEVRFVDFYRYCDVSLSEMMDYLDERLPWVRPSDTGRSTNCLINEVGIYVHKKERGYHNYAFPYSWDVRVGHKTREETLDELDDDIDVANAERILREIGYDSEALHADQHETRLAAYYVSDEPLSAPDLRTFLAERLPAHMVPSHFVHLDEIPLNATGKIDRQALPQPGTQRPDIDATYEAPRTEVEQQLARIWADVLGLEDIGVHDNFFDLGGESILAIQIGARASEAGLGLTPNLVFQHQTIAELAAAADSTSSPATKQDDPLTGQADFDDLDETTLEKVASLLREADRADE